MTFQKWLDSVNGKFVDFDGRYGAQCVDLIRFYLKDYLGVSPYEIESVTYAKDMSNSKSKRFQFIKNVWNDLDCTPIPGDIVIWGWLPPITGIAGHVGICTWADGKNIIVMNQNYGPTKFTQLRKFSYKGVRGWLRFIK